MKTRIIPVVLTAALTSLGTLFLTARFQKNNPFVAQAPVQFPVNYASYGNNILSATAPVDFQQAAEGSVKAVVHIKTTRNPRTVTAIADPNDVFGQFFGQRQYYTPGQTGSGSGVVISQDGYIVTNNHVVAGTDQVTVTFNDRLTTQAKVISTDPSTDIALLKVEEKGLPYMEFGNSDEVRLGQWVLAVGYPLTLDATVTAGIVSAKSRSIGINRTQSASAIESFIQTDAAVNPGNSGGALVNTNGQLVGINSAIASPTGSYAGYSYAIPANIVHKVVNDLMQYGTVQRGYLGIEYLDRRTVSGEQLTALKIDRTEGVYVASVRSNSGAEKAGIQKGDFITHINGVLVRTEPEMQEQVSRYKPGDNLSVTILRNGTARQTTVQLKNIQETTGIVKESSAGKALGATIRPLSSTELNKYGLQSGLLVTDLGNGILATKTNMRKGFIIVNVNDKTVKSSQELRQIITSSGGNIQIAGVYPGTGGLYYYGLSGISEDVNIE